MVAVGHRVAGEFDIDVGARVVLGQLVGLAVEGQNVIGAKDGVRVTVGPDVVGVCEVRGVNSKDDTVNVKFRIDDPSKAW